MLPVKEKTVVKFLAAGIIFLILSFILLGKGSFVTGIAAGLFISLVSLFFLSLSFRKFPLPSQDNIWKHFARGFFLRFFIMGLLFYIFLCIIKVNPLGILAGLFLGLIVNAGTMIKLARSSL